MGPLDRESLGVERGRIALEIGFGGGEHLLGRAAQDPGTLYIGVEPFLDGVGKLAAALEATPLDNLRFLRGDARPVLERMNDGLLSAIYLMFPDPWPKARHAKRRFVQPETVAHFARLLVPGGRLVIASDVKVYLDWALWHVRESGDFDWQAKSARDWRTPPEDHVATRYEAKNIGDCQPTYLQFVRIKN